MNNDLNLLLMFFRAGKSYRYRLNDETYEINAMTINKLREKLVVPFKAQFYEMSRAQVVKIISCLLDSEVDVEVKNTTIKPDGVLSFEATFTQQKKYIDAYKVPDISTLYGRSGNCNPFLYTNINSKKVLIEVTKDFAKENIGDYYFLGYELVSSEKESFCGQYVKLECDHIYRFEKSLDDKKKIKKKLRKNF